MTSKPNNFFENDLIATAFSIYVSSLLAVESFTVIFTVLLPPISMTLFTI